MIRRFPAWGATGGQRSSGPSEDAVADRSPFNAEQPRTRPRRAVSVSRTTTDNVHLLPVVHSRGGAPVGNANARRHGVFSKVLQPRELRHLDSIAEELRDALGDSYSPRFEVAIVK